MPNWVTNILTVDADEEKRKEIFEAIKDDTDGYGSIDFNKIIPMPESLNIESGSNEDYAIAIYLTERLTLDPTAVGLGNYISNMFCENWQDEVINRIQSSEYVLSRMDDLYEMGKQYISNIKNYGFSTWYDWCRVVWGTKWNATSNSFDKEMNNDIQFDTAWNTPEPIIIGLSEMFPDVTFTVKYADENFGCNCGEYACKNGVVVFEDVPFDGSEEAMELASEVLGYYPEYDDEDEYDEE